MPRCSSPRCGAEIIFARSSTGRLMPFDAQPTKLYTLTLAADGSHHIEEGSMEGHQTHFATCVDAARFRKVRQ